MKVAITGGAGFIGSHLVRRMLSLGHAVSVIDDLSSGHRSNVPDGAELLELDLADESKAHLLPAIADVVYHLAGQASSERSMLHPANDLRRNLMATLQTVAWVQRIRPKRFVFTSTMGVYRDRLGHAASELDEVAPKSVYGINKRACEEYIWVTGDVAPIATVLRLFNVYGPGQDLENPAQGMVSIYLAQMREDSPVIIKGPLDRERDFVYIDDVVEALEACLDSKAAGQTLNVATGKATSVSDLLSLIGDAWPGPRASEIQVVDRTPADIDSCYGDPRRIESLLGWTSRVTLEDGIRRTIQSMEVS